MRRQHGREERIEKMAEAYTDFAQVYDIFMDDTPYEDWCGQLVDLLEKYGDGAAAGADAVSGGSAAGGRGAGENASHNNDTDVISKNLRQEHNTILDLGCGTGTLTELLAGRGYDMIGIDSAQEMLQIAMEKRDRSGADILYLQQDMRSFELYGAVGAVVSVCDSVNYLLTEEEVLQTFRLVGNYLLPGGLFLFDFNTVYKYEAVIGDATIAENRETCSFIWDNYYHEEEQINEYDLTLFVREDDKKDLYRRFQETHYQRGYTSAQMRSYLEQAGLEFLEASDADTHGPVTDVSERVLIAARRPRRVR